MSNIDDLKRDLHDMFGRAISNWAYRDSFLQMLDALIKARIAEARTTLEPPRDSGIYESPAPPQDSGT